MLQSVVFDHDTLPNCHPLSSLRNRFQAKQYAAGHFDDIPETQNFSLMWIRNLFFIKVTKGGYQ